VTFRQLSLSIKISLFVESPQLQQGAASAPGARRWWAARSITDEGDRKTFPDQNISDVLAIGLKRSARTSVIALARAFRARRTCACDFGQPDVSTDNQFSQPQRRPLSQLTFVFALGRKLFRRVETNQPCACRLANYVDGVSVSHCKFLRLRTVRSNLYEPAHV
jgi:hypothetical protein